MRVGLFLPNLIYEDEGRFTTDASTMHKLPVLAKAFDGLDVVAFVCSGCKLQGRDRIDLGPRVHLERLAPVHSGLDLYFCRLPAWMVGIARTVARHRNTWSSALVIDSGPASHWFFECCHRAGIPTAIYTRGDASASITHIDRYQSGIRHLWRWCMGHWYPWSESRMARCSPLVTDSDLLAARLRAQGADVRLIVASLVRPHHLASRPPEASLQPQPLRICWIGRMVRLKGLHVLLEALSMLARDAIAFSVDLVGHGDESYVRELQARASCPDLDGKVRFLGPAQWGDGLFKRLDRSEVFVLPSFTEGTPKTVTEAMARGLVVVASRVGGLARLVADGETGFLVSAGDPCELSERLRALALNPDLRRRMAANTLKKASGLTMDEQLPILVTALKNAAAARCVRASGDAEVFVAHENESQLKR